MNKNCDDSAIRKGDSGDEKGILEMKIRRLLSANGSGQSLL
jgi:hypothetical protein